ncbi:MAG TPA: MerR family transcriptional regulator [Myxococcales bacterium]|nr:MerR family transcriptional regulator [Methylomirabilota bacterium]HYV65515.1 MerR family transcriptional regulator [Myxococcales bacterium]
MSGGGSVESGEGQGDVAIPDKLYYRIGEVEALTEVPAYVLRYWESEFRLLRPKKNPAGQRLYRRRDLDLVLRIKTLLYDERLTLEGAKKRLLIESRGPAQLDLGVRSTALEGALRRLRDQLRALRDRLNPPKS